MLLICTRNAAVCLTDVVREVARICREYRNNSRGLRIEQQYQCSCLSSTSWHSDHCFLSDTDSTKQSLIILIIYFLLILNHFLC